MTKVTVTRKGQTTIPAELWAKYHIEKESRLDVIDAGN
jgi:bifunctional DNA-binding transcriptional regulator/antitoxin component of YhaV-PrlF toxin-antitoxin module